MYSLCIFQSLHHQQFSGTHTNKGITSNTYYERHNTRKKQCISFTIPLRRANCASFVIASASSSKINFTDDFGLSTKTFHNQFPYILTIHTSLVILQNPDAVLPFNTKITSHMGQTYTEQRKINPSTRKYPNEKL